MRACRLILALLLLPLASWAGLVEESPYYRSQLIEPGRITKRSSFHEPGAIMNAGLQYGKIGDTEVFVKTIATDTPTGQKSFLNEAGFTKKLSEAGIGARFLGITKTKAGYAIVTEKIAGQNLRHHFDYFPAAATFNQNTLASLQKIESYLQANPTVHFDDLQLRISSATGQVLVIDPGKFTGSESATASADGLTKVRKLKSFAQEVLGHQGADVPPKALQPVYEMLLGRARDRTYAGKNLPPLLNYYSRMAELNHLNDFEASTFVPLIQQILEQRPGSLTNRARKALGIRPHQFQEVDRASEQKLTLAIETALTQTDSPLLKNQEFLGWWKQIIRSAKEREGEAIAVARMPLTEKCGWYFRKFADRVRYREY